MTKSKEAITELALVPSTATTADDIPARRPALVIKYCRGRLGGSAFLLSIIQRARASGRKVTVIDGDEASRTVRGYYPNGPDATLIPAGTEVADLRQLMLEQLGQMVEDRISRIVDVSGGSRDLDEMLAELDLSVFCRDNDIDLIVVAMLGSVADDLSHATRVVEAGLLQPSDLLLVLNSGRIDGLNPANAFLSIMDDPRFKDLKAKGATVIRMPKLAVMKELMDAHADVYQVAATAQWAGKRQPIWHNMAKRFIAQIEQEFVDAGIEGRLP